MKAEISETQATAINRHKDAKKSSLKKAPGTIPTRDRPILLETTDFMSVVLQLQPTARPPNSLRDQ